MGGATGQRRLDRVPPVQRARHRGPLDQLPQWAQVLAWFNPLYHLVELVRHAVFGWDFPLDLAHMGILVLFGFITWRVAVAGMTRKLIT